MTTSGATTDGIGTGVAEVTTREGRLRSYVRMYTAMGRVAVLNGFQYRVANLMFIIGMIAEPIVYLVVWSTVARQQGGSIDGYTPGTFAAYYIVWTLVRNMNIVFTPFGWEQRIREGEMSAMLLRPIHPIHYDIAFFNGWKVVTVVLWLPVAAGLSLIFRPTIGPSAFQVVVFIVALWGAYLIRTMFLWVLGMITFWTTRVSAIFEVYFALELILSGRLVPPALMPDWVQGVSRFLPFESTFGFPITALVGPISTTELVTGLLLQLMWIAVGATIVALVWKRAVRRYSAVSG